MDLYKKCTAKWYSFLVIDATLEPDNLPCFRKNILERIKELSNLILTEKQQKNQHYLLEKLVNMNIV